MSNSAAVASDSGSAAQPPAVSASAWSARFGLKWMLRAPSGMCERLTSSMRVATTSEMSGESVMPGIVDSAASTSASVSWRGDPHGAIVTLFTTTEFTVVTELFIVFTFVT